MAILIPNKRKRHYEAIKKKDSSLGYNGKNKEYYSSMKWRNYSVSFRKVNRRCYVCNKIHPDIRSLAVDHKIPIEEGGSRWNPLNHGSICKAPCHSRKSGKEAHGYIMRYKTLSNGERVPA